MGLEDRGGLASRRRVDPFIPLDRQGGVES